jgi:phosphoethanolamine N-methyltransferase
VLNQGQLEIVDESIEVIFSKEAFIHIPDKIELIRDIHRVLKPGGYLAGRRLDEK